jgi:NTE family protein
MQSSSVPITRYSYESVQLMRDTVERWEMQRQLRIARHRLDGATEAEANARARRIALYTVDVSFDAIPDAAERDYFLNLPTSFSLPPETIDRLRAVAGRLLRESPDYRRLIGDWGEP